MTLRSYFLHGELQEIVDVIRLFSGLQCSQISWCSILISIWAILRRVICSIIDGSWYTHTVGLVKQAVILVIDHLIESENGVTRVRSEIVGDWIHHVGFDLIQLA
jgi:hypothetical protein